MKAKLEKSIDNSSGIYCIENIINKKKYVGRAIHLRKRLFFHKSRLNNNKDQCIYLQNAWNKYGEENFSFYVLEYCKEEELNTKEQNWINVLNTFYKNKLGYNLTEGGKGIIGFIHSDKTKQKISSSKKNPSIKTRSEMGKSKRGIKINILSTSKYVGVSFDSKNKKWKSQFIYMRTIFWLGRFETQEKAALAYNLKAVEICGCNAIINDIGDI